MLMGKAYFITFCEAQDFVKKLLNNCLKAYNVKFKTAYVCSARVKGIFCFESLNVGIYVTDTACVLITILPQFAPHAIPARSAGTGLWPALDAGLSF